MNAAQKAQYNAWEAAQAEAGEFSPISAEAKYAEAAWQAALASQAEASFGFGDGYIVYGDKRSIEAVRKAVFVENNLDKG